MSVTEIAAVIFDCDGTLVDSETLSLSVLIEYVAEFGLVISADEAHDRFAGNELSVVLREIEQRLGCSLPTEFLHNFRRRQMSVLREHVRPIDGAHRLLAGLRVPFCLASNAPRSKIELCLETTGLHVHFSASRIHSAYEVDAWKPRPDLFLKAAAEIGVPPQRCAVVEDSVFGIEAGLAAGMQVCVYDPHNRHHQFEHLCRVRHLDELESVFGGINNR
ncbi:MAG: HAD family hydrolase [Planctomycetaceae bacterium]|nr:HAD family hydrolase [Planctomycetaceae bacterium]